MQGACESPAACLIALLAPNLTQCLVLCWLTCIVATRGVQPQPPCRHPPLHDISIDEDDTEVDFHEHDWRFVSEPTPELPGQSFFHGTNRAKMRKNTVVLPQVHSHTTLSYIWENRMVYRKSRYSCDQ